MTTMKLSWPKRARIVRSELTTRKQWQSKEGPRVLLCSLGIVGNKAAKGGKSVA